MIAIAMTRGREPDHRRTYPARGELEGQLCRASSHGGSRTSYTEGLVETVPVTFSSESPRCDAKGPRRDDQRSTRVSERCAKGFNGFAIGLSGAQKVTGEGQIMFEREMYDSV